MTDEQWEQIKRRVYAQLLSIGVFPNGDEIEAVLEDVRRDYEANHWLDEHRELYE